MPPFVLAPILLLYLVQPGVVQPTWMEQCGDRVLPALTMGTFYAAFIARLMRASLLDVLKNYIMSAQAKGRVRFNPWNACLA